MFAQRRRGRKGDDTLCGLSAFARIMCAERVQKTSHGRGGHSPPEARMALGSGSRPEHSYNALNLFPRAAREFDCIMPSNPARACAALGGPGQCLLRIKAEAQLLRIAGDHL